MKEVRTLKKIELELPSTGEGEKLSSLKVVRTLDYSKDENLFETKVSIIQLKQEAGEGASINIPYPAQAEITISFEDLVDAVEAVRTFFVSY